MLTRFLTLWPTKLKLTLLIAPATLLPYLALQRFSLFEPRTLELTWLDRAAGFAPGWVWVYVSYYPALVVGPWLATTAAHVRRFVVGWFLVAGVAWLCFLVYPVDGPRPPADAEANWLYRWLVEVDMPGNALPSLHLAFMTFAILFADHVMRSPRRALRPPNHALRSPRHRARSTQSRAREEAGRSSPADRAASDADARVDAIEETPAATSRVHRLAVHLIGWPWLALVGWSTMATKQHYFVDVVAGVALGVGGHALVGWMNRRRTVISHGVTAPARR